MNFLRSFSEFSQKMRLDRTEKEKLHFQSRMALELAQKEKEHLTLTIANQKSDHDSARESLYGEIALLKKENENLHRLVKQGQAERERIIAERQAARAEQSQAVLDFKKCKDELDYARQAEHLSAEKFQKFTKDYYEMKSKFEAQREDRTKTDNEEEKRRADAKKVRNLYSRHFRIVDELSEIFHPILRCHFEIFDRTKRKSGSCPEN